ncbi:hypothetical protein ABPG75_004253 [Micractinium tetrahymenae]
MATAMLAVLARRLPLLLLLAAAASASASALVSLPLHEQAAWRLDNGRGFGNVSLEGFSLPAAALQLLHREGIVGDPLYRFNELEQRWAAWDNWTFSLAFQAPTELLAEAAVELLCEGLDTVAEVALNSAPVGRSVNAHRPHAWDVTGLLAEGRNLLEITLFSAPAYALAQQAAYPYSVPATQQVGSLPAYNFIRKAASDFGWDWGPAFAPAGINGPVELRGRSTPALAGMAVRQQHFANGSVELTVDALLLPPPAQQAPQAQQAGNGSSAGPAGNSSAPSSAQQAEQGERGMLLLQLVSPDGSQHWQTQADVASLPVDACSATAACRGDAGSTGSPGTCPWLLLDGAGSSGSGGGGPEEEAGAGAPQVPPPAKHSLSIMLDSPQLWWPHDLGAQPLYTLQLRYQINSTRQGSAPAPEGAAPAAESGTGGSGGGSSSQALTRRIGLRQVELVTQPLPATAAAASPGETFFFQVNGQPLYARGANIVPAHVFEPAVTAAQLRQLVGDARAAHMNMLRVWGGGRYFADAFYDACDEAGLLVWQEAMFACAMYPRDRAFLSEAWQEVSHQAVRLSSHPSISIWGGNNENEAAFGWFAQSAGNPQLYAADFAKLFVDVVREAVLSVDPGTVYVDTSPSNGLLSHDPYVKRWGDVGDPRFGDIHFYSYAADALSPATYPPAKFVSEFGFMSLPSFSAYKRVTAPEDWSLAAPMTGFRMRHANGLSELSAQMELHFLTASPQQAQQAAQQEAQQAQQNATQQLAALLHAYAPPPAEQAAGPPAAAAEPVSPPSPPGAVLLEELMAAPPGQEAAGSAGPVPLAAGTPAAEAPAAEPTAARSPAAEGPTSEAAAAGPAGQPSQQQRRFAAFIYLSQLQQGLAYQTAVHQWRRNKADPTAQTMGVLYWQLNDIWQGPSWSGINADGSWRLLHHFAASFFSPVLVSGLLTSDGTGIQLEVHLTNDLPVGVTGLLSVDAIPFNATRPEQVVPIYRFASAGIPAFGDRLAWSGSLEDVLAAAGNASSSVGGGSGSGTAGGGPADPADVFLRLRYCPTTIQAAQGGNGTTVPNPFLDAGGSSSSALQQGSGGHAAERQAAASDGSEGGGPCSAPVVLPGSASAAQCAAARRLLQCSESLVFLTELKDARLAPANVSVEVAPAGSAAQQAQQQAAEAASNEALGGSASFSVRLNSDAVALFVSVEAEQQAGRFNGSALLLLPWQPQTLLFFPAAEAASAGPDSGGASAGSSGSGPLAEPGRVAGTAALAMPAAEQGPAAEEGVLADPPTGGGGGGRGHAPNISVYWLQQALAELQPEAQPEAASSAGSCSVMPAILALLVPVALLCASWL